MQARLRRTISDERVHHYRMNIKARRMTRYGRLYDIILDVLLQLISVT